MTVLFCFCLGTLCVSLFWFLIVSALSSVFPPRDTWFLRVLSLYGALLVLEMVSEILVFASNSILISEDGF